MDMYKLRAAFDIAPLRTACRLLPVLTNYFHVFPLYTVSHSHIIAFMSTLNTDATTTPPEIQHAILEGLVGKVNGMDITDILVKNNSKWTKRWHRPITRHETETDALLRTLILNSLKITTEQNSADLAQLVQTRIVDLVVLKMHKCLDQYPRDGENLTLDLTLLLQLLQLRPYHTGRGFVFVAVTGHFGNPNESPYSYTEKHRFEVPSSEKTKYISEAVRTELRDSLTNPECVSASREVSRVTIVDILEEIRDLSVFSDTHRAIYFRILPLLIQNTRQQTPEVGRQWIVSDTRPDHMMILDRAGKNTYVTRAVYKNTMLKESLEKNILFFSDATWREFQLRQSLYVPRNSTLHQRGLCSGWVKLNGRYYQPVVQFTLHNSLCRLLQTVMMFINEDSTQDMTASIRENIRHGLVFIEAMLGEIMDVQQRTELESIIQKNLSKWLQQENLGMEVHAQTCHVMRQLIEKLDIPKSALLPEPSQSLFDETSTARSQHLNRLYVVNKTLPQIACSSVSKHLFKVIGSVPQQTPQQCAMVLDASVILTHIHAIKAEKFSVSDHQCNVSRALKTAHRNPSQAPSAASEDLVRVLSLLSECCAKGFLGVFGW